MRAAETSNGQRADPSFESVDRLDDREPIGMGSLHFHRITRVVAVHGKGRDEDRAIDADLVHRPHHLVTRNVFHGNFSVDKLCIGRTTLALSPNEITEIGVESYVAGVNLYFEIRCPG
jgi:hypothetical protein